MNPLFQWDVFMVERNVRKMVLAAKGPLFVGFLWYSY